MKQQQKGFTLIELIIVIVILGILAVTAAPRFLDLSSDARKSAMQGVLGAVKSASQIAHAAMLIRDNSQVIDVEGIVIHDGTTTATTDDAVLKYPQAEDICELVGLQTGGATAGAVGTPDASDSLTCTVDGTGVTMTIADTAAEDAAECFISYTEATTTSKQPVIIADLDKC